LENPVKKVIWSPLAIEDLKDIYAFHKSKPSVADKVSLAIFESISSLIFCEQFQKDEHYPLYRRIVVGHYKVLYHSEDGKVTIVAVVDCRRQLINKDL